MFIVRIYSRKSPPHQFGGKKSYRIIHIRILPNPTESYMYRYNSEWFVIFVATYTLKANYMKLICSKFLTKEFENLLSYIIKMKIDIQGVARDPEESLGEKLIRYKKFLPGIICKPKWILATSCANSRTIFQPHIFRQGREFGIGWSLGGALSLCRYWMGWKQIHRLESPNKME